MKNKIISFIVLMLLVCVCISPLPCVAAENAQISLEEKTADPGDEVVLLLNISNNPGIAALSLTFSYEDALTLLKDGEKSNGDIFPTLDIGRNFFFSADGNCNGDGVLAKLIFKVSPTAKAGVYPITFVINECYSFDGKNFTVPVVTKVGGSITVNGGADITEAPDTATPVTTAAPASTAAPATTAKVTTAIPVTTAPVTTIPTGAPVTTAKPTSPPVTAAPLPTTTPHLPTTVEPVLTEAPSETEAKPVTEPTVLPAETTKAVISTAKPVEAEPVVTDYEPDQTQAPIPVTQPLSGDTSTDGKGSLVLIISAVCVVVLALAIFLIKKKNKR